MPKRNDEKLLERIRKNYDYALAEWKDIREQARIDMRYLSGDPWDEKIKAKRQANGRQCVNFDELNQYVNQVINQQRQSQTAISIRPEGMGANDETAELHQGIIRDIEYNSKAQAAYITALEGAAQRGYGYARVGTTYVSDRGFEQAITIERIPNPDSVLPDPDFKEADGCDMKWCFVLDRMRYEDFKTQYPKAKYASFTSLGEGQEVAQARQWFFSNDLILAEYWEVEVTDRRLLKFEDGERPPLESDDDDTDQTTGYADDYGDDANVEDDEDEGASYLRVGDKRHKLRDSREVKSVRVCQYITNGMEILEEHEVPGEYIPIAGCYGKEIYVAKGESDGAKKVLMSLVRLARDPAMAYAYIRSQELEEAALTPRAPFIAYEGQIEGYEDDWAEVNEKAKAFLLVKEKVDTGTGNLLEKPTRPNFQPNFQAYEIAAEACRRAIQAACGIMPLPTAAQRQNEKSGVALERVQTAEAIGSFHFVDNYKRFLEHVGRIVESWLPEYYDTAREVSLRKDDGTHQVVRINDPAYKDPISGVPKHYDVSQGKHKVTVTTGPSYQSQREAAEDFANLIAKSPAFPQVADLIVRLRKDQIGPLADEIADRLTPPQFAKQGSPQQAVAQLAQLQRQTMALNETLKLYEQKIQQLEFEKKANVVSNEYKLQADNLKMQVQLAIAQIETKAQELAERHREVSEVWAQLQDHAHERQMAEDERQHQIAQAEAARQAAAAAAAQGGGAEPQPGAPAQAPQPAQ